MKLRGRMTIGSRITRPCFEIKKVTSRLSTINEPQFPHPGDDAVEQESFRSQYSFREAAITNTSRQSQCTVFRAAVMKQQQGQWCGPSLTCRRQAERGDFRDLPLTNDITHPSRQGVEPSRHSVRIKKKFFLKVFRLCFNLKGLLYVVSALLAHSSIT